MHVFDNTLSCASWILHLYKHCGGDAFFDESVIEMRDALDLMEHPDFMLLHYAEMKLIGSKGIDISAEYPIYLFDGINPFKGRELEQTGEFLQWYASLLKEYNPPLMDLCYVYLEADTSQGKVDKVANFINLRGAAAFDLYSDVLKKRGQEDRIKAVGSILERVKPYMRLWHMGFMDSREENPLRLTMMNTEIKNIDNVLKTIEILGGLCLSETVIEKIRKLADIGLADFFLDFDVMPDGSIGDTVGLELNLMATPPMAQIKVMRGDKYKAFVSWLKEEKMADDRIDRLPAFLWGMVPEDGFQPDYFMYSTISHFKLKWHHGKAMEAKVYLQLSPCPLDININQGINRAKAYIANDNISL